MMNHARCSFRPLTPADLAWAAGLNQTAVPHVNALSEGALWSLANAATWARIAALDGADCALILAFAAGDSYDSDNFLWFERWHADFLYIDRIIVDPRQRRRGAARAIYRELASFARTRFATLVCEVNLVPPNPASVAFHQACGFRSLCARRNEQSAKQVLMLRKSLI